MKISKKSINVILAIIFFIFALVQLNDPDAIIWFLIYAIVSFICIYSNFKIVPKKILVAVIILLIGYALFHLSLFIDYLKTEHKEELFGEMVYQKPYLEGSREFLGLLLAALGVFYQLKRPKEVK
ncbi:Transmembrane family 220, helix [Flaviramulus basaltis]|uniref:Transmembrane family 220, helix n=1 Tax=Flaviramulus basaltis TaxID=369401 RepID=A0A1K2IF71_9FLAO|nr:transmembrane 220 family protein [Flaviramulus basaltis]SFZ90918.1 Transmembrane family 220, helix [Flaviramulus basaltis]